MSSDEASSGVTYTSTSSDYEEPSDTGSPGVVVYGYDGLPMHPVDPLSPDYVRGPEEPKQAPLSLDYVPGPEYPEYLAPSDDEIPIEDQPYAAPASPVALSLGYIADPDPEEDPEDESEDGPADYPTGGGEDDDDDSSGDDADDEEEASKEDEEEEEHLALTDSTTAASPVVDLVPSAEETKPFETDEFAATPPPPAYRTTARMSIRALRDVVVGSIAKPTKTSPYPTSKVKGEGYKGLRLFQLRWSVLLLGWSLWPPIQAPTISRLRVLALRGALEQATAPAHRYYVPDPKYPEYLAYLMAEIPIEDQLDESEDGPMDYLADGGDDDDDDSSGDDTDNKDEEEASEEDEEEEL
ncbi:hypothetical protein Tco_0683943 [Tanacetum coccineum]